MSPATKTATKARNSTTGKRNSSDEAVRRATGKSWDQWFALLDKAGAAKLDHKRIVAICAKHCETGWWCQMVTVEYEQARGLRKKHETTSGFSVSRSKTFEAPISAVYAVCSDPKKRTKWLGPGELVVRKATANKSMRITWCDGATNVEFMLYDKGSGKTSLVVQHSKLADAKAAAKMKDWWGMVLERLPKQLG
jgi:uncharacterized protein YndB with AHSA1/START domain